MIGFVTLSLIAIAAVAGAASLCVHYSAQGWTERGSRAIGRLLFVAASCIVAANVVNIAGGLLS